MRVMHLINCHSGIRNFVTQQWYCSKLQWNSKFEYPRTHSKLASHAGIKSQRGNYFSDTSLDTDRWQTCGCYVLRPSFSFYNSRVSVSVVTINYCFGIGSHCKAVGFGARFGFGFIEVCMQSKDMMKLIQRLKWDGVFTDTHPPKLYLCSWINPVMWYFVYLAVRQRTLQPGRCSGVYGTHAVQSEIVHQENAWSHTMSYIWKFQQHGCHKSDKIQ